MKNLFYFSFFLFISTFAFPQSKFDLEDYKHKRDSTIAAENAIIQQQRDSILQAKKIQRDLEYKKLQFQRSESVRKNDSIRKANYAKAKAESERIREQYKDQEKTYCIFRILAHTICLGFAP